MNVRGDFLGPPHGTTTRARFKTRFKTSAGKELFSWLSACVALLYNALIGCIPFLFCVTGRTWNRLHRYLPFHLFKTLVILLLTVPKQCIFCSLL